VRRLAARAGLPADLAGHLGPHAMRRSFAVLYLDAGGSLRDLQNALGLTDPRATGRYDRGPALGDRAPADSAPSDSAPADRAPGDLVAAYLADPAS
jgi:integrase